MRVHLSSIEEHGLQPRIGHYVETWYRDRATAHNIEIVPLILAVDKKHLVNALLAIFAQFRTHKVHPTHDSSRYDHFLEEAALLELPSEGFKHRPYRGDTETHPLQVERGDFYRDTPVAPLRIITGEELRTFGGLAFGFAHAEARNLWNG